MKTKVIKIGNSRGIRIPKSIIDQSSIQNEVELEIKNDQIIIKPLSTVRQNWSASFKEMAKNKDDVLLDSHLLDHQVTWDKDEWVW